MQLGQGTLVQVSPSLVKRRKTHFHNLPCGASIILGNNGYIWIAPTVNEDTDNTGGFVQNLEVSLSFSQTVRERRVINQVAENGAAQMSHPAVLVVVADTHTHPTLLDHGRTNSVRVNVTTRR